MKTVSLNVYEYPRQQHGRKILQLAIEDNAGSGYRISGPTFNGGSTLLKGCVLNQRDADEIRAYLDAAFPAEQGGASQ